MAQVFIVNQKSGRVVPGVKTGRQRMQVMSHGMHRALAGGAFDQVRKAADEAQQVLLMIAVEPARRLFADFPAVSQAPAGKLAKNTGNARRRRVTGGRGGV